jgi:putative transposase
MPRRNVTFSVGESFHLFNRGNNSQKIFLHPEDYENFLKLIDSFLPSSAIQIHALTLLPNHYHLSTRILATIDVSAAMRKIQARYARMFNKKYRRHSHVFGGRFKSPVVESIEYSDYLSRYIHRNPVEAGLVKHPGEWPYSSFALFVKNVKLVSNLQRASQGSINGTKLLPLIHTKETLGRFSSPDAYREFVMSDLEKNPWRFVNGMWSPK